MHSLRALGNQYITAVVRRMCTLEGKEEKSLNSDIIPCDNLNPSNNQTINETPENLQNIPWKWANVDSVWKAL